LSEKPLGTCLDKVARPERAAQVCIKIVRRGRPTIAQREYNTHLVAKVPRVADIVSFQFERPPGYGYRAGQWFVIAFADLAGEHVHHFSHSNSPADPLLEFTTRLRSSDFKTALDALPLGAEVEVEGPYGAFSLAEKPGRVAFITGGIGITCVRSVLRWLAGYPRPSDGMEPSGHAMPEEIVLLYANRSEKDIPFRDELREIQTALPTFRVVHVLSHADRDWPGYRGHVNLNLLGRELPEAENWNYYLSGPPTLVQSMRELLLAWGIGPSSIKAERFDGYE
jgi:ferredoxin-NADP reductase